MKKLLLCLLATTSAFAQPGTNRSVAHVTTYQPPTFTDGDRLKKLEAAFPIVEKLFKDAVEKRHFPGLAFGIVLDGKLVYSGGLGYTDVAKKTPATPKSLFRIASMTKSLTGMAILKLRDEGKLRLDDPAELYIPELKSHKYLTADAPKITIRNLLTHSAGFPEDNPWGDRQLADSDADLLKLIKDGISNANVPSFAYEYSNLGFAMLGHIITVVSGKPYQQYITDTILKPLGMNDTQWEYTRVPTDKLALGYRWQDDKWLEEALLHDGSYGAMGGLITSIDDFSKYVALHESAWPPKNDADTGPIKRSSIREMQQPWTFSGLFTQARNAAGQVCPTASGYGYGLGWSKNCTGQVGVGHSGGLPGFGSQWRILPDYGIGVISYANLTYAGMGSVNTAVLDTLVAIGKLQPRQLPVSPILAQRKAELIKLLPDWTGAEQSGIFAENFFPDKSVAIRRKVVQDLYAKAGKIQRVGELIPENQLRGHFLLEGEKANIDVFFTLTPENPALIQQLDFREVPK
ncbi:MULTISPECIES: serine hydrolase [unclassified Spirosoma]|uniref:serine hydrolase domain-containing protein n=1 Tax=unclassified Spirosoma TaxID=2621999 RepID=UPI0009699911|nr:MULTISPECIES: serine hydrolase domain-containing protein [unclassified Spirosoma]MBN8824870.1 beta-lactamase family protein [Spirosoma sp.]OJW74802.1 MAG: serine hydrolase [Spirosoma sp. 48-14]